MLASPRLVSHQLRTSYLDEIADGVGERLLTVNESFLNSTAFKAAGWRPASSLIKRTYSPPIPTAVASEYFQAPQQPRLTLEDGEEDGGMLTGGGAETVGPGLAFRRRRRREHMDDDDDDDEEDEDSSDLTDESEDEVDQRAAQQIKFAKMPVRRRAGSSPARPSSSRQATGTASPKRPRRGSQTTPDAPKGRLRRDTVTSSEVSSENEFDALVAHKHREAARAAARAVKLQENIQEDQEESARPLERVSPDLLPEEEEDSDELEEGSDISGDFVQSIDSASMLDGVENPINASPTQAVVGTPPKNFTRRSTIRKSQVPATPAVLEALPPPRPLTTIRPLSVVPPKSLLSAALKAKQDKPAVSFQKYAHFSGQGTNGPIAVRVYAAFSETPQKPYEVLIRPRVYDGQGAERVVTVADLIGLSLYRYTEEGRKPPLPPEKLNINWWMLRMVEEGGDVDDDFPPLERTKPLTSFTTNANAGSRGGGRLRSNSSAFGEFALVGAREEEYKENTSLTPEEDELQTSQDSTLVGESSQGDDFLGGKTAAGASPNPTAAPARPRQNPIVTTTYRPNTTLADMPQLPAPAQNVSRGQQKLLRIYIMSSDTAPGQMVTLDVTTDTYLAEVLDSVCRKRQLDKANHVLKLPHSGAVVMIDRPVSSIGNVTDLELCRRRFPTESSGAMAGSLSTSSPKGMSLTESQAFRKGKRMQMQGPHPLAREHVKQDELGSANYKKYIVWRKQAMRLVGLSERLLVIDGEYIHIVPAAGGKAAHNAGGKTTTVHFSNVIGCKVLRKHPTNVKVSFVPVPPPTLTWKSGSLPCVRLPGRGVVGWGGVVLLGRPAMLKRADMVVQLVVYKATESKRYDFEARSTDEAAEIVSELKKGIAPYHEV